MYTYMYIYTHEEGLDYDCGRICSLSELASWKIWLSSTSRMPSGTTTSRF